MSVVHDVTIDLLSQRKNAVHAEQAASLVEDGEPSLPLYSGGVE